MDNIINAPNGGEETLDDQLMQTLRHTAHSLRHAAGGHSGQTRILRILAHRGGINQRELMEFLGIQAGSLSEALGKLETAGYIQRSQNETDRRSVDITLTKQGLAAAELAEEQTLTSKDLLTCLSDDEKQQLTALLEKLNENWRERFPHRGGRGHGRGKGYGGRCGRHGHGPRRDGPMEADGDGPRGRGC